MAAQVTKSGRQCQDGTGNIGSAIAGGSVDPGGKLVSLPKEVSLLTNASQTRGATETTTADSLRPDV